MDDALSLTRCQHEESQAARMIYSTSGLYNQFIKWVPLPLSKYHSEDVDKLVI